MATVLDTLHIVTINPPTLLPTIYVTVSVGQTKAITRAMVDAAQTYYQSQGLPLGSINIKVTYQSGAQDHLKLLSQTNTVNTIAYFTNVDNRVYMTPPSAYVFNGQVTKTTIDANRFSVTGVKVGTASVKFRATAHNGSLESANSASTVVGTIVINVIGPNQKPNALSGGVQDVIWDSLSTIMGSTVTNNYADPEDDAPYMVKITTLPTKGTFYYQGLPVILNQEIPYAHIQQGLLVYDNNGSISVIGTNDTFRHTVSDTGSQQYY